jgi:hypothetical protein
MIYTEINGGEMELLGTGKMKPIINILVENNVLPLHDLEVMEEYILDKQIIIDLTETENIKSYDNTPVSTAAYFLSSIMRRDNLYKDVFLPDIL